MKNMHQESKADIFKQMSCKIFYSYWLWFLFFNSGLSPYGRSLLAAEIDVPLSQGNPLRLNSGTRGWWERCELTTLDVGPDVWGRWGGWATALLSSWFHRQGSCCLCPVPASAPGYGCAQRFARWCVLYPSRCWGSAEVTVSLWVISIT